MDLAMDIAHGSYDGIPMGHVYGYYPSVLPMKTMNEYAPLISFMDIIHRYAPRIFSMDKDWSEVKSTGLSTSLCT